MAPTSLPTAPVDDDGCADFGEAAGMSTLQYLIQIVVVMLMLGMGANTRVSDYVNIIKNPKAPAIGFVSQFGVMPCLAFILAEALGAPPEAGESRSEHMVRTEAAAQSTCGRASSHMPLTPF